MSQHEANHSRGRLNKHKQGDDTEENNQIKATLNKYMQKT